MQNMKWLLATFLVISCSGAFGQAKSGDNPTVGKVLDSLVSDVEGEFVSAADAMPADKYSYAPTNGEFKGVRTFAQQVKHVAAMNYIIGASIIGENPPVDVGSGNGPDSMTSKADIIKFLKDSFAYAHKAVGSVTRRACWNPSRTRLAKVQPHDWVCPGYLSAIASITTVKWLSISVPTALSLPPAASNTLAALPSKYRRKSLAIRLRCDYKPISGADDVEKN